MKCPSCHRSLWFARTYCPFCRTTFYAAPRPTSIKVLAWFFIVASGCFMLAMLSPSADRIQMLDRIKAIGPMHYIRFWATPFLMVISAVGILRGLNWARWALVVILGANLLTRISTTNSIQGVPQLSLNVAMLGVASFYLFRPAAGAFFQTRLKPLPVPPPPLPS
jgi:hypothetical protein